MHPIYPDLEILISPIKGYLQLRINQLFTIYQSVHITYFNQALEFHIRELGSGGIIFTSNKIKLALELVVILTI